MRWYPVNDMLKMQGIMNKLFDNALYRNTLLTVQSTRRPLALNIYNYDDGYVVEAALPGFQADQIDVSVEAGTLHVKAMPAEDSDARDYLRRERFSGAYERSLALPEDVDGDAIEAKFENGLLNITLPKREPAQVRV